MRSIAESSVMNCLLNAVSQCLGLTFLDDSIASRCAEIAQHLRKPTDSCSDHMVIRNYQAELSHEKNFQTALDTAFEQEANAIGRMFFKSYHVP